MSVASDVVKRRMVRGWIADGGGLRAVRLSATEWAPWRIPVSELERLTAISDSWTVP